MVTEEVFNGGALYHDSGEVLQLAVNSPRVIVVSSPA